MIGPPICASGPVSCELPIDSSDYGALGSAWSQGERDRVERAIKLKRGGEFLVRHPEHAIRLVVRQRGIRRCLEYKLRREHDPGKSERFLRAVQYRENRVTRLQLVGIGECLS